MTVHVGMDYAVNMLRYDRSELDDLPNRATARFAGVGNPHRIGTLEPGETVVDIGCGGGMDLLVAADRVGPTGRAIGIDPAAAMREASLASCIEAGVETRVRILEGTFENLPLPDGSVDVVISNHVLNLVADKQKAIREVYRVLVPGGRLHLADVFLDKDLKESGDTGALIESEIIEIALNAGFKDCRIVERFDCVHGGNFFAQKQKT